MTLPMGDYESIRAARPEGSNRKPERRDEPRFCGCGVRLSAYNLGDSCYAHTDRWFRRVRITPSRR